MSGIARLLLFATVLIIGYFAWRYAQLKLKQGVSLENVSWRMFHAAIVVENAYKRRGIEAVITSASDGKHSALSKHYPENNASGMVEALDFRTWHLTDPWSVRAEIATELGSDYDVVLESDHLHVEYDPKA